MNKLITRLMLHFGWVHEWKLDRFVTMLVRHTRTIKLLQLEVKRLQTEHNDNHGHCLFCNNITNCSIFRDVTDYFRSRIGSDEALFNDLPEVEELSLSVNDIDNGLTLAISNLLGDVCPDFQPDYIKR